jgi:hypothetical protein
MRAASFLRHYWLVVSCGTSPYRNFNTGVRIVNIIKNLAWGVLSLLLVIPVSSSADVVADNVFRKVAHEYEVPSVILYAVACAESAKPSSTEAAEPWPWTLTIAGQRRHYPTRDAAQSALDSALEHGISNIEIGLMQINWRRYHDILGDRSRALDPEHNLRVGASILRAEWYREGDLWRAIGHYHSESKLEAGAFKDHVGAEVVRLLVRQVRAPAPNS